MTHATVPTPLSQQIPAVSPDLRPAAKGWCPGAHRAMAAGDGLLVRVRPPLARVTLEQALGLCELAQTLGSGMIELTRRANLQLRGIRPANHDAVLKALCQLGLVDQDPVREAWPAVLVAPGWQQGDDTHRIASTLVSRLGELPCLPSKFGFAVDVGAAPVLTAASADVRIERSRTGGLIVRADGAPAGHLVSPGDDVAVDALLAMAAWFAATAASVEPPSKRMRLHQQVCSLPRADGALEAAAAPAALPEPGMSLLGPVYGVAFGQVEASALSQLLRDSGAVAMRLTPQRGLILEGGQWRESAAFLTSATDFLLRVDACPGAPSCASATVQTRTVARAVALQLNAAGCSSPFSLHVSGCAKGCARVAAADLTLVGRNGAFDLVRQGRAWDLPAVEALSFENLCQHIGVP